MNPYSPDIIQENLHFDVTAYSINRHSHEESISVSYLDNSSGKIGTYYFIEKAAIHTCIMEILDYDMPEKESSLMAYQNLKSSLSLLAIDCPFDEKKFQQRCSECSSKDIEAAAKEIIPILQASIETHPALSYLYPLYYEVMRSCYLQTGTQANTKLLQTATLLSEEVENLNNLYAQAKKYLANIIIEPNQQGIQLPGNTTAAIYHSYCLCTGKNDFLIDSLSAMKLKTSFLQDADSVAGNWSEYLNNSTAFITNNEITTYPITSFRQLLFIGIRQLLEDELIIKRCKLCNGYFRVKYTSSQEYCTRIYRDTSTTCNEYASRKSYKEKLFSHPIHTEFTKSYNRLYARIRRGKLPADTPLMDQLKALHDEYIEKYENTHQKDREAIWKEYIEKNKELLKLDRSKS